MYSKDLTFDSGYSRFVVVECENCGAKGPTLAVTHDGPAETDTQSLATIAWNQRSGF
jgi:hypothetical protein